MIHTAALALVVAAATALPSTPGPLFSRQFDLLLVSDSIWGHCDMSITVMEDGAANLANACNVYDGPVRIKSRQLQVSEIVELRTLLRQADLFGKVSPGSDDRGLDLPFIKLQATAEGRTTNVVCFRNPDFERDGPRKRLFDKLMMWYRETRIG